MQEPQDILGISKREEFTHQVLQAKSDDKYLACLLSLKRLLKVQFETPYGMFQQSRLKEKKKKINTNWSITIFDVLL